MGFPFETRNGEFGDFSFFPLFLFLAGAGCTNEKMSLLLCQIETSGGTQPVWRRSRLRKKLLRRRKKAAATKLARWHSLFRSEWRRAPLKERKSTRKSIRFSNNPERGSFSWLKFDSVAYLHSIHRRRLHFAV